jgi:peptidase C13-like protein
MSRYVLGFLVAFTLVLGASRASANGFETWAAIVVAGDFRAHSGAPSEVFDNARRDLAKTLVNLGFGPSHIKTFSVRPETDMETNPLRSEIETIDTEFRRLARYSSGGCFLYFTSHGAPQGILIGNNIVAPNVIAQMVNDACADRMTVVVVSACFSGVFVPALRTENRMILTAARPDRTSFGCGEANAYTFFDQCFLESVPQSRDFPMLATKVQDCVAQREVAEMAMPPSEPQVSIGFNISQSLTAYSFAGN